MSCAVDVARPTALVVVIPGLVDMSERERFLTGVEVLLDSVEAVAELAAKR